MDEIKFDELKNFSVPDDWVKSALEIPSKKPEPAPKFKLYRYAAAIAACAVIAAAVIFTAMFKSSNNVSPTIPEPESAAKLYPAVETTVSESSGNTEAFTELPADKLSAGIRQPTANMEPSENKADTFENENDKKQTAKTTEPTKITEPKEKRVEIKTQSSGNEGTEPLTVPCVEGSIQTTSASPAEKKCYVETSVSAELDQDDIFCRLEDSDGNIAGNSGLFSENRLAEKQTGKNGTVILSYTFDSAEELNGRELAVVFYNSNGGIIKKSICVPFFENLYFKF